MAAVRLPPDHPPDGRPKPISYKDVVSRPNIPIKECTEIRSSSVHRGEPALLFSADEYSKLADPFHMTLVGHFADERPSLEFLRKGFQMIGFKGDVSLGLLDANHVLLRFAMHEDFYRCWIRGCWTFKQHVMRVLKWTPDFIAGQESPVCPVWVSFHHLPIHLFQKGPLLSLASIIGKPLRVDAATKLLSRPSVARVCIEINVLQPLPKRIWIGVSDDSGFWQQITYDELPHYCTSCSHFDHETGKCSEAEAPTHRVKKSSQPHQQWRPKTGTDVPGGSGLTVAEKASIATDGNANTTLKVVENSAQAEGPIVNLNNSDIVHNDSIVPIDTAQSLIQPQKQTTDPVSEAPHIVKVTLPVVVIEDATTDMPSPVVPPPEPSVLESGSIVVIEDATTDVSPLVDPPHTDGVRLGDSGSPSVVLREGVEPVVPVHVQTPTVHQMADSELSSDEDAGLLVAEPVLGRVASLPTLGIPSQPDGIEMEHLPNARQRRNYGESNMLTRSRAFSNQVPND